MGSDLATPTRREGDGVGIGALKEADALQIRSGFRFDSEIRTFPVLEIGDARANYNQI